MRYALLIEKAEIVKWILQFIKTKKKHCFSTNDYENETCW